ncbi:hypothetical protein U3516DRAFT_743965 [Neocallimastix sp. 'constans']
MLINNILFNKKNKNSTIILHLMKYLNKIDELINENRDTYKDKEKLEEIENQISSHDNTFLISAYLSETLT